LLDIEWVLSRKGYCAMSTNLPKLSGHIILAILEFTNTLPI
jgi:hypothetical protein